MTLNGHFYHASPLNRLSWGSGSMQASFAFAFAFAFAFECKAQVAA
jgi:hypothetical protein